MDRARRFLRYGIVGVLSNLAGYGLFVFLLLAGTPPVAASGATYLVMVTVSYLVNRKWAFRSDGSHTTDMPRYALAYGIGLIVAMGAMHVLSSLMHPALAQVLVIVLAACAIFASLEILRFGRAEARDAD